MTVQLEVGMTAIRRDGERVGQGYAGHATGAYPMVFGGFSYTLGGQWKLGCDAPRDIIAAGYSWTDLGAQLGDTVHCVWDADANECVGSVFIVQASFKGRPDNLYILVKRADAPKPADRPNVFVSFAGEGYTARPRAAHKLDLQDGDVVELMGWQSGGNIRVGEKFTVAGGVLHDENGDKRFIIPSAWPKGHRPLFRVISRAANAKPDELIVLYGPTWGKLHMMADTHRITLTFPHGSDAGTVTREKL